MLQNPAAPFSTLYPLHGKDGYMHPLGCLGDLCSFLHAATKVKLPPTSDFHVRTASFFPFHGSHILGRSTHHS